jgi:drug/metabolite transporter (DMT)-like permease
MNPSVLYALAAAALFGASTPFAKLLVGQTSPVLLAGLLYLGSGLGLALLRFVRDRGWRSPGLARAEWPWLLAAIAFGGVLGPLALMFGLTRTSGATASLLLNLEAVLTAVFAWVVFRENAGRRIVAGMAAIVAGGVVLSWPQGDASANAWPGALAFGFRLPDIAVTGPILLVGFLGYGVSLVLFVLALRGLGTARTGAYFSTAPFLGAVISLAMLHETVAPMFWLAAALMAFGVWLHLTERHVHDHVHEMLEHGHRHVHDAHHQHTHPFEWDGAEPHSHPHVHVPMRHSHPHFPDIHHRHTHE